MSIETDVERADPPPATDEETAPAGATEADALELGTPEAAPDATAEETATGETATGETATGETATGASPREDAPSEDAPREDTAPAATADRAATARGGRRPWLVVAAAVLVIGLVVAATWLAIAQQAGAARDADRAAAVSAARQTVVTMTTTDPAHAQQSFQQLTELATGSFGQQLQAQSETFVRVVQSAGVTSRSEITESALQSGDDRRATVLVVANSVVQNSQAPQGEPRQYRMKLDLDKQGDRWLVSNLDFVA